MAFKKFTFNHLRNLKKSFISSVRYKSFNSHEWLKRRESDVYLEKTKMKNYRCRSAFKLLEMDDRYKLLQPGYKVLDVGAAPGSWSQVIADRVNSNRKDPNQKVGLTIAVDLHIIHPIEGVITLWPMDFRKETTQQKILEHLNESESEKFDCILCDMAPASSGVKNLDQEVIQELVYPVIVFSVKHLREGGSCVVKLWQGNLDKLKTEVGRFFKLLTFSKPKASYTSSAEIYLVAREFLGLKK